jgi:hypothetical protein
MTLGNEHFGDLSAEADNLSLKVPKLGSSVMRHELEQGAGTPFDVLVPGGSTDETISAEELHRRIISPGDTETVYDIPAYIIGEKQLEIGGQAVSLRTHGVFVFNVLMLCRDQPRITRANFNRLGFYPNAPSPVARASAFKVAISEVLAAVNPAAGRAVIKKHANSRFYAVEPTFGVQTR